jgi:hypothetical protein
MDTYTKQQGEKAKASKPGPANTNLAGTFVPCLLSHIPYRG